MTGKCHNYTMHANPRYREGVTEHPEDNKVKEIALSSQARLMTLNTAQQNKDHKQSGSSIILSFKVIGVVVTETRGSTMSRDQD